MAKRWIIAPESPEAPDAARSWGVTPLVAQLLINRGLSTSAAARQFLTPKLTDLHAPELLPGAVGAAQRISDAIRDRRRIVLYGDYDVDGTTGVAILWHVLHRAGADVSTYVPHRIEEGYGLNLGSVERLIEGGAKMIITIDCGITAVDVAKAIRRAGVSLIITDHHTPADDIPDADAIVHPTVGGAYPNESLCGAGVAFKLAWAIAQQLGGASRVAPEFRDLLVEMLPLAALGTIADVVPLTGENRIIARHGLGALPTTELAGLRALIEVAGLTGERVSSYDVGFKLAPRINAAGRMGHADLAVELLTNATPERASEITMYLDEHNRARQATERKIVKEARQRVEGEGLAGDARRAIVLASKGWHAGVIGIVAARIVERYHRPTILIALENGEGQGSGRSIRNFDLHAALAASGKLLTSFGGHAMAAGLRIAEANVDAFTEAFVATANNRITHEDLVPKIRLDAEISLSALSLQVVESVSALGPFGNGNPKPKLATQWLELAEEPRLVGRDSAHLSARFREGGVQIKSIGFGLGEQIEALKNHRRCRVAFEPIINEWNGRRTVEMQVLDMKFPE